MYKINESLPRLKNNETYCSFENPHLLLKKFRVVIDVTSNTKTEP